MNYALLFLLVPLGPDSKQFWIIHWYSIQLWRNPRHTSALLFWWYYFNFRV